jgi:hypothetical protein
VRTRVTPALAVLVIGLALNLSPPHAHAAFIIQPAGVSASSDRSNREAFRTTDGSGLSDPTIVQTDDPVPTTWPTHSTASHSRMWYSNGEAIADVTITFDLGEVYEVSGMHVWNLNSDGNNGSEVGVEDLNALFSSTGTASGDFGNSTPFTFDRAPELSTYEGEDYALGSPIMARYVQFDIETNYGHGSIVGLSEVRFTGVPEPSAFLLLAVGALLAVSGPRKRRA